jgi:hypothetical protein
MKRVCLILAACLLGGYVNADVTVTMAESGGDVVATASGNLDMTGLSNSPRAILGLMQYNASDDYAYTTGSGSGSAYLPVTVNSVQPLNSSVVDVLADVNSGVPFGVEQSGVSHVITAPTGCTPCAISSSSTWQGQTLASLGLTGGSFVFDYGPGNVITFVVPGQPQSPSATSIPTMGTYGLILAIFGLFAVGAHRLSRARVKAG